MTITRIRRERQPAAETLNTWKCMNNDIETVEKFDPVMGPLNLAASEQLEHFYYLRHQLQEHPEDVSEENKKAFCHLILGHCPAAMDMTHVDLVEKLFPEEWRRYCESEWGTPEELRAMEEERLLEQGWERGPHGGMYVPL